ncbi:UNKNOWN [Stylonychia lemnae]|uniref:Uncharacterized protein n=1 Tax=Stylonychia lemnae TaxID=5949 RepID=A0A078ACQ7_STYLE|nr:UNKNOWN [Stylonychia lemnae]|eukprot:CDW78623.1 UNKNOWN [Stylonychia lemnae]
MVTWINIEIIKKLASSRGQDRMISINCKDKDKIQTQIKWQILILEQLKSKKRRNSTKILNITELNQAELDELRLNVPLSFEKFQYKLQLRKYIFEVKIKKDIIRLNQNDHNIPPIRIRDVLITIPKEPSPDPFYCSVCYEEFSERKQGKDPRKLRKLHAQNVQKQFVINAKQNGTKEYHAKPTKKKSIASGDYKHKLKNVLNAILLLKKTMDVII